VWAGRSAPSGENARVGSLDGKTVALVVAHRGFRETELLEPRARLERDGASVLIASSSTAPAQGMEGGECYPDVLYSALQATRLDGLVFVGGTGAAEYFADRTAHRLIGDAVEAGKVVGGICFAASTLANAGVLEGRPATCAPAREAHLRSRGAVVTGAPVTVSERVVTGRGPDDAQAFADALASALAAEE